MATIAGRRSLHPTLLLGVQLVFLAFWVGNAAAQGLIVVPKTVTRELGGYYISKLGLAENGLNYYAILSQRNVQTNVYNYVNDIADSDTPRTAAAKISNVRGLYETRTVGGKVKVESFFRLLRCGDDGCFAVNRLIASAITDATGTTHVLSHVKTAMGASGWLVNAPQAVVNTFLTQPEEQQLLYVDGIFKTKLFYKVATPPPPCRGSAPQTQTGSISEFQKLPGFACINVGGTPIFVGTSVPNMITVIKAAAVPFSQCDGSLGILYSLSAEGGPRILRWIQTPGEVPLNIVMDLPPSAGICSQLYDTPDLTIQAAQNILAYNGFIGTVNYTLAPLASVSELGFAGRCAPVFFASGYGVQLTGQNEAITDGSTNKTLVGAFAPYSATGACVSMMGVNQPSSGSINFNEDECAAIFLGNTAQQTDGVVTYLGLDPDDQPTAADRASLLQQCADPTNIRYKFDIQVVLPQMAADFETDKNFLVSSTEVKLHLDGVAANAASVLAVEVALATSGIVVARMIARSGLYRRRRIPSNFARALALIVTAVVVTLFNIPNFALISKSLSNKSTVTTYTQASIREYRPTNFSAVIRAETHSFVEVTGSSATAIIGLLLYGATMVCCLYLTWSEFTEIIQRRIAAESRLGQDALIADKDLLVQWRGTDSLVYDTLHPKKVVESAQAQELEIMRRNLGMGPPSSGGVAASSPRTPLVQRPGAGGSRDLYPDASKGTPDLYPDV
ncbi:hypothetical protein KFL_003740010 [Klebsormidium nitens]|uniref:Transmembrane protein n=1 Tax=Klebsormidium nitens TaxID=105231 RepID=A0A1Y1I9Z3_KLENI|nr:hypothetical protein KFL_003740010 [Klebsormidium nitens]|eukprot:GAQ87740.1 hypothetical protein KFL_003740010 [Klebsormidium nitens]